MASGKYNRSKGHQFERDLANILKDLGFKDCITARAGDRSRDNSGIDLLGTYPFAFQCKNMQEYATGNTLGKVKCKKEEYPVVLSKGVRKKPIAILYMDDFLEILKMLKQNEIL